MNPKFNVILEIAIEQGVKLGYNRAFKHNDNPSEGVIVDTIISQVMDSIYEYFEFE